MFPNDLNGIGVLFCLTVAVIGTPLVLLYETFLQNRAKRRNKK